MARRSTVGRGRRMRGIGAAAGVAVLLVAATTTHPATTASAGPNRCGTSGPQAGQSTWLVGPAGSTTGYAGVDPDGHSVQAGVWTNHSAQAYVAADRQCVIVGDLGNAPNVGEFPIEPAPKIVPL